ncbi:AraC-like DNA-binding protein [Kordia periserrulae]|uniref:AraC-like DNA-binding protein n=1 Tax=Kordia periserrulae TaxID=701523 RepID=A0A2T6BRY0_9FLAO|nr:AraC family transcriptional regulator [Kordia periserrulae]PTX58828.1 AraC-like DNA-binding protein [Kordia periserrulae]
MKNRFFFLFLSFVFSCYAQQGNNDVIDNFSQLSYEEMIDSFYNASELKRKESFLKSILHRAKKEKDTSHIQVAYYLYSNIYNEQQKDKAIIYLDSVISLAVKTPNKNFPAIAFLDKGSILHEQRNFKAAINSFLKAHEYAELYYNELLFYSSNYHIAKLKDRIGFHDEALKIHRENLKYVKENIDIIGEYSHLNSIFALAFTHKNKRNLDSASYYNKLGLKLSEKYNIKGVIPFFNVNEGVILYLKNDYSLAKEYIEKSRNYFLEKDDLPNLSEVYFYLGKIAYDQNKKNKAIQYFKKVDTIFNKLNDLFPELRENYILLSKYYKANNDLKQQLFYTEKLNEIDSILNNNHIYISDYLKNEYDIPKIVSEKEELINSLKKTNASKTTYIYITVIIICLLIIFFYRRQKKFKRRFEELVQNTKDKHTLEVNTKINKEPKKKIKLDVPKDLANTILIGLNNFEENKGFLDANMKLSNLAELLGTNTNYLSKTINYYKGKNINLYLNDLRVDYAIHKIQEDSKFRNYTIRAIAKDVGFKSSETFSKTFYKKTGIYPSYFIKQLENNTLKLKTKRDIKS